MYPTPPDPDTTSKISRLVAWVLAPLITIASAFIANEAQVLFNANLDGAALAAYLSSISLPVGGFFVTWIYNRGKGEIEKVKAADPAIGALIQNAVDESISRALAAAEQGDNPDTRPPAA